MTKVKSTNLDTTVVTLINDTVTSGVANVVPGAVSSAVSSSVSSAVSGLPVASNVSPKITSVQITDSNFNNIDDTAVSTSGGFIKIFGTGFVSGCSVLVNNTLASAVAFVNSTELRVQLAAAAAGTYVIYLLNPDGAVAIRVNGISFSANPTWSTGTLLTQSQIDSAISIQLSATSNSSVTYSLQAGSVLPPGLTLSSSGLLSGTVTGLIVETTYNFTVLATDAELQETPQAFSITITVGDQYFKNVVSLLSATTPTSTFITDASTNNFAVTVLGDTRPSNFSPYTPGYYSNFFDGNGDYLSFTGGTATTIGTNSATVEFWMYPTANDGFRRIVVSTAGAFSNGSFVIRFNNGNFLAGSGSNQVTATLPTINRWHHVAWVGVGGTSQTLYINGVSAGTAGSYNLTESIGLIGGFYNSPTSEFYAGYLSNLRIVNGTAVYTSNFTPSTTPLTLLINTNSALLTCQSNRLIDNSANNFTLTRNGDVRVDSFDPFTVDSSFVGRGSGFFDGGSDYLDTPTNAAFGFGTGDFTIEAWVYPTAVSTTNGYYLIDFRPVGSAVIARPTIYYGVGGGALTYYTNGSARITGPTLVANQWYHIAVSRSGSNTRMFVNGSQVGSTYTTLDDMGATARPLIGNVGDAPSGYNASVAGYISDVRVIKGTALYTANFTPPATPLTAIANTSLLILQNNRSVNNNAFLDSSTTNTNITRNGNPVQGTFSPYGGGWSCYFDGTGDYLSTPGAAAFSIPTNTTPFTVEAWVYLTSSTVQQTIFCEQWPNSGPINMYVGFGDGTTNPDTVGLYPVLGYYNGSSWTASARSTTEVSINTWVHVAFVFTGSATRIFINGVDTTTAGAATTWGGQLNDNGNEWRVGKRWDSVAGSFLGYISNFRFVKGTAVYTANFTVPTTPLTPIANTVLLTCADNRLVDDSANNLTLTRNGDVSVQRFNPFSPVVTTPTSYSAYFDGTGDFLTFPQSSLFNLGTSDFTIEGWVNYSTITGTLPIFSMDTTSFPAVLIQSESGTLKAYATSASTSWDILNGATFGTIIAGQWYHFALTRQGSSFRTFLNGVLVTTVTSSGSIENQGGTGRIGQSDTAANVMNGYLSDIRVVRGTALYTSNFTPPTTPLTAVANTSLLTCQSATFVDNSTNAFAITANGDVAPRQFNPFGWTSTITAYTPAVYGGSAYFDGTGDFLSLEPSTNLAFGTADFTIELWVYPTAAPNNNWTPFLTIGQDSQGQEIRISQNINNTGWGWLYPNNSNNTNTFAGFGTLIIGQWHHIAMTRSGSNLRLFRNGALVSTATSISFNFTNTTRFRLGLPQPSYADGSFIGYISNVRISRGTAHYTSAFSPPIVPVTPAADTTLEIDMTSASIYDSTGIINYETAGNAGIDTAVKKYGSSSMYFDGTGDYLFAPSSSNLGIGSGDFTVEVWIYPVAAQTDRHIIDSAATNGFFLKTTATAIAIGRSGTAIDNSFTYSFTTNTWFHVAVSRQGSSVRAFVNGTQVGATASNSVNYTNPTGMYIGSIRTVNGEYWNGYITDLRITRGVARYTANFTPTTAPFVAR